MVLRTGALAVTPSFWRGKRVLLTGHTGFKGGWAAIWLSRMGAQVTGLALAPDQAPSLFDLAGVETLVESHLIDIRDGAGVARLLGERRFDLVLHMAAQPIVRAALEDPVEAFATNVLGTAHLLQALRAQPELAAVLVVTTDKVYANPETGRPFVEADQLGGKDPYAASKAACELTVAAFARSYFDKALVRWPPPGAAMSSAAATSPATACAPTSSAPPAPARPWSCATRRPRGPGSMCSTAWPAISPIWRPWRGAGRSPAP